MSDLQDFCILPERAFALRPPWAWAIQNAAKTLEAARAAAVRGGDSEAPCAFNTEHVYDTCTTCGADCVRACKTGGNDT